MIIYLGEMKRQYKPFDEEEYPHLRYQYSERVLYATQTYFEYDGYKCDGCGEEIDGTCTLASFEDQIRFFCPGCFPIK